MYDAIRIDTSTTSTTVAIRAEYGSQASASNAVIANHSQALASRTRHPALSADVVGVSSDRSCSGPGCYHPSHDERVHVYHTMMQGRSSSLERGVITSNPSRIYSTNHTSNLPSVMSGLVPLDVSRPKRIDKVMGRIESERRATGSRGVYRSTQALQGCFGDCQEDHYGPKKDVVSSDILSSGSMLNENDKNNNGEEVSKRLGLDGKVVVRGTIRGAPSYRRYLEKKRDQRSRAQVIARNRRTKQQFGFGERRTNDSFTYFLSIPYEWQHFFNEESFQVASTD